jgi:maleate isomerase
MSIISGWIIMSVEYASKALVGVLTPQANTTVEPEYSIMTPLGSAWINARMLSRHKTIEERLIDYWARAPEFARQFANAPITSIAFACTGTSYLVGKEMEDSVLEQVRIASGGIPAMSAATSVVDSLRLLGAKKIGLVSPYAGALDAACTPYWESRGFEVAMKTNATGATHAFHPIYSLPSGSAQLALDKMPDDELDAIVMLGTGMPTLAPIARTPYKGRTPVLSCMFCVVWLSMVAGVGEEPTKESLHEWLKGAWWRQRMGIDRHTPGL